MSGDREFFAARPERLYRVRPSTAAEAAGFAGRRSPGEHPVTIVVVVPEAEGFETIFVGTADVIQDTDEYAEWLLYQCRLRNYTTQVLPLPPPGYAIISGSPGEDFAVVWPHEGKFHVLVICDLPFWTNGVTKHPVAGEEVGNTLCVAGFPTHPLAGWRTVKWRWPVYAG